MATTLAGKIAFVTGGGSGIGRAACKALAKEGAKVIVTDQNIKNAEDTVASLTGSDHVALNLDVSECESVETAFKNIDSFYTDPPTILINSAGVTRDNFLLKLSPIEFQRVLQVNLTGTFLVTRTGVQKMLDATSTAGASVVNISSIIGKTGNIGQCNYAASKAGVEALTKSAAMEFGKFGIRVNAILPGIIDTDMIKTIPDEVKNMFLKRIPLGRIGKAEEVAELILFLSSDRSAYVNGASIEITGGLH
ncbi:estradiol 17-beta-dehydrogenase 8 isoform X1 [Venturia canescens]|uniref:estradiol 17-beta-dehydrogenase 8 isoform X1 n=1 Tax=Venturia canescens TaxID=32260 RepID=UPI001C9CF64E|nr:estradiol 17-beta-dehydrogenase 8 isoform X1 [Venturia canescens]